MIKNILSLALVFLLTSVSLSHANISDTIAAYECPESDDCAKRLNYVNSALRYGNSVTPSFCGPGFLDALNCNNAENVPYYIYYAQSFWQLTKQECIVSEAMTAKAKCDADEAAPYCVRVPANTPATCAEATDMFTSLCSIWQDRILALEAEKASLDLLCSPAAEMRCTQQIHRAKEIVREIKKQKKLSASYAKQARTNYSALAKLKKQLKDKQTKLEKSGHIYVKPIFNLNEAILKQRVLEVRINNCIASIDQGNSDCSKDLDSMRVNLERAKADKTVLTTWFNNNRWVITTKKAQLLLTEINTNYGSLFKVARTYLNFDTQRKNADAKVKELGHRLQEIAAQISKDCADKFKDELQGLLATL